MALESTTLSLTSRQWKGNPYSCRHLRIGELRLDSIFAMQKKQCKDSGAEDYDTRLTLCRWYTDDIEQYKCQCTSHLSADLKHLHANWMSQMQKGEEAHMSTKGGDVSSNLLSLVQIKTGFCDYLHDDGENLHAKPGGDKRRTSQSHKEQILSETRDACLNELSIQNLELSRACSLQTRQKHKQCVQIRVLNEQSKRTWCSICIFRKCMQSSLETVQSFVFKSDFHSKTEIVNVYSCPEQPVSRPRWPVPPLPACLHYWQIINIWTIA